MDEPYFENECNSFCSHGGCCMLDNGHDGLHDSTYCKWSDAEALTEAEADAVLAKNNPEFAQDFFELRDFYETVIGGYSE